MNVTEKRLLPAILLALALHGALLSYSYRPLQPTTTLAKPLPGQRITVSLGERKTTVQSVPEAKQSKSTPSPKPVPKPRSEPKLQVKAEPKPKTKAALKPKPQALLQKERSSVASGPEETNHLPVPQAPTTTAKDLPSAPPPQQQAIQQAAPLYRENPPPKYPRLARRRNLEGVVLLSVLVDEFGKVRECEVANSSGHNVLDKAALKAVRCWRFTPGTVGGKPQEMWVKVPIRFHVAWRL